MFSAFKIKLESRQNKTISYESFNFLVCFQKIKRTKTIFYIDSWKLPAELPAPGSRQWSWSGTSALWQGSSLQYTGTASSRHPDYLKQARKIVDVHCTSVF